MSYSDTEELSAKISQVVDPVRRLPNFLEDIPPAVERGGQGGLAPNHKDQCKVVDPLSGVLVGASMLHSRSCRQ